eukprot:645526-Rhodomonas_salina.1
MSSFAFDLPTSSLVRRRTHTTGSSNNRNTEECDDGNEVDGGGCSACVTERCGDGILNNNGTGSLTTMALGIQIVWARKGSEGKCDAGSDVGMLAGG